MIDVNISMNTKQYDNLGNEDLIEVTSKGSMYEKNNDIYIVYKEELEKGSVHVTTTIKISGNEVFIKRFGDIKSDMKFVQGEETITKYRTPQGLFDIKINTQKLEINKLNKSIQLNIEYNMCIDGLFEGINKVRIYAEELN